MASEDALYRQSTQYRLWSFSAAQLASTREKTNALARSNISETLLAKQSQSSNVNANPNAAAAAASAPASGANTPDPQSRQPTSSNNNNNNSSTSTTAAALPEFLTPAEELQLLNFYTVDLLRAGNFFSLRTDMRATAAVFLRRFYVTNSIMTYPPTEMLKTCLFFGCKAEGHYPNAAKFAEQFEKTTGDQILAGEFLLCQGLRFSFDVRHPFRALEGAVMELRRYGDIENKRISSAHSRAREILKFSPLVTDVYFHYTPSQIMLAALSLADQELAERVIHETFLHHHQAVPPSSETGGAAAPPPPAGGGGTSSQARGETRKAAAAAAAAVERARLQQLLGAEVRERVAEAVKACREELAREPPERMASYWGTPESHQITRPLLRKLRRCRDPDRWDLVAYQTAKREQQQQARRREGEGEGGDDGDDNAGDADGAVFGDAANGRDVKRRKVAKGGLDDPFGGPL